MKRLITAALVITLCFPAISSPASAKKAKPIKTTLYMHGDQPLGELDGLEWQSGSEPMTMDAIEPSGTEPKNMHYTWAAWNDQCTGLPLFFPTWVGSLNGTIKGDATLTAHFVGTPATATARIWVDTEVFLCNGNDGSTNYIPPHAEISAAVPEGQSTVEFAFQNLKLKAGNTIMVEILEQTVFSGSPQNQSRVLYDSTDYPTKLEFSCIPAAGQKTCVPE